MKSMLFSFVFLFFFSSLGFTHEFDYKFDDDSQLDVNFQFVSITKEQLSQYPHQHYKAEYAVPGKYSLYFEGIYNFDSGRFVDLIFQYTPESGKVMWRDQSDLKAVLFGTYGNAKWKEQVLVLDFKDSIFNYVLLSLSKEQLVLVHKPTLTSIRESLLGGRLEYFDYKTGVVELLETEETLSFLKQSCTQYLSEELSNSEPERPSFEKLIREVLKKIKGEP